MHVLEQVRKSDCHHGWFIKPTGINEARLSLSSLSSKGPLTLRLRTRTNGKIASERIRTRIRQRFGSIVQTSRTHANLLYLLYRAEIAYILNNIFFDLTQWRSVGFSFTLKTPPYFVFKI